MNESSQSPSGQNTVEARPPPSVSSVMAVRDLLPAIRASVAKAGS
jgi:hypothetical protein